MTALECCLGQNGNQTWQSNDHVHFAKMLKGPCHASEYGGAGICGGRPRDGAPPIGLGE